jgi:hypothetical protein
MVFKAICLKLDCINGPNIYFRTTDRAGCFFREAECFLKNSIEPPEKGRPQALAAD